MMIHGFRVLLVVLALTSCAIPPPAVRGHIRQLSDQDAAQPLAVARAKLARTVPDYSVYRVWIEWHDEVWIYYRSHDGPLHHLVVKRIAGDWRVTAAPPEVDTMYEDIYITP